MWYWSKAIISAENSSLSLWGKHQNEATKIQLIQNNGKDSTRVSCCNPLLLNCAPTDLNGDPHFLPLNFWMVSFMGCSILIFVGAFSELGIYVRPNYEYVHGSHRLGHKDAQEIPDYPNFYLGFGGTWFIWTCFQRWRVHSHPFFFTF